MLTISQETFAERLVNEYGVEYGKSVPLPVDTGLGKLDKNESPGN